MKQTKHVLFGASMLLGLVFAFVVLAKPQTPTTEQPIVISAAAPIFPPLANAGRVSADVIVEVEINLSGDVTSVHADGHALLIKVCEAAARRWKFAPAEKNAGSRIARLTFTFRSLEKELPEDQITPVYYPAYRIEVMHNPNILQTSL